MTDIILGKILDEGIQDYHASTAVSHSKLETFRRRPLLYKRKYLDKSMERETSAAFTIGQAAHTAILEPDQFRFRFVEKPANIDRRTKDGKAAYEAFLTANAGREVLDPEDYASVLQMRRMVAQYPLAAKLVEEGEAEVTWRAASPNLPVPLQCRTDCFNGKDGYILDLKTTESLQDGFDRSMVMWGYHRQAAFYLDLLAKAGFTDLKWYFLVVEKKEPFGVALFQLDQSALQVGHRENAKDLVNLAKCYETNTWPNLPETIMPLALPSWYKEVSS